MEATSASATRAGHLAGKHHLAGAFHCDVSCGSPTQGHRGTLECRFLERVTMAGHH